MTRIHLLSPVLAIWIFGRDHNPPHFHIRSSDLSTDVCVEIATLRVIVGTYRAKHLADGLAWAAEHRDRLMEEWKRHNELG